MLPLPPSLAAVYRPATDREVWSRSFGAVKAPRDAGAGAWQARRGTLDDQAIFGPLQDFRCACGKYAGERHSSMVCDICGVKVTTHQSRRERFGHFNLPVAVLHPFGEAGEQLSTAPILPAAFWQSPAGSPLGESYDELARKLESAAVADQNAEEFKQRLEAELAQLFELLLPVATIAYEWNLAESQTLAQGLALERREIAG